MRLTTKFITAAIITAFDRHRAILGLFPRPAFDPASDFAVDYATLHDPPSASTTTL